MWRTVGAIVAGLLTWAIVVTILNFGLRLLIPGYHAAEPTLQFTLAMKIGRLCEAAVSSIVAGALAGWIAREKKWPSWAVGLIILALFLPEHVRIWSKFPVWYHLGFLLPLVPLVALGAFLVRKNGVSKPVALTA